MAATGALGRVASRSRPRGRRVRRGPGPLRPGGLRTYVLLAAAVALSLFPLYWMFVVGSNDSSAISRVPPTVVPGSNFLRNASRVVHTIPFLRSLLNTAIVATAVTASVVFFSTLAGFAFARLRFRGRGALFLLIVATMIVPVQLGIIPQFMVMVRLGWVDRLQAVIVPGLVTAFGVFWMRQYISAAVPQELVEAGRVDGCSTFRLFWSIVLPASRPGAAVLGLFTFMQTWNEFLWPLVVLRDPDRLTVQVALQGLNEAYFEDYGMVMAGTVLSVLPLLVIFVLLGRQIVGGIMQGALKG